ncbi:MAG: hypothetical protein RLZZ572_730, partial [Pseudomonadota bacterium]
MTKHTLLALLLSVFIPVAQGAPLSTQKISGLKMPESVVQATDGRVFVSEINGFGVDGDGQISVIEAGQVKLFAKGLDDPKGLAIIGQSLYVADNKRIL